MGPKAELQAHGDGLRKAQALAGQTFMLVASIGTSEAPQESTKEERSSCSSLKLRRFALLLDRHTKDAASALSLYYNRFLHNAKEARASPGNLRSQRNAFEQHFPLLPLRRFKSSLSTRTLHPSFGLNRGSARVLCCGIRCHFPQGFVPLRGPRRLKIGFRGAASLPGR